MGSEESVFFQVKAPGSMRDIVWGKVKSHPWWSGQIFDEALALPTAVFEELNETYVNAFGVDLQEKLPFEASRASLCSLQASEMISCKQELHRLLWFLSPKPAKIYSSACNAISSSIGLDTLELKARFAQFGPFDSVPRLFWKSSTCRIVFRYKSDAQMAYRYNAGNKSLFGNAKVDCYLQPLAASELP
ncbi:uncharacterized protein LOC110421537 [Herrania umbratica]|uniref:Uncharacterized protein LOC110421537 n=1 Tax=Herrania umbratica TaxID=108875 RepID=A0A6J1AUG2_9ROSI|nr:uncharacterized protein LOC110421537 [Herrania umbratica]